MRRSKTIILLVIVIIALLSLVSTVISTLQGSFGRIFMDLYQLRFIFNGAIWLIIGLVIGYFIGVVDTTRKQNKEKK